MTFTHKYETYKDENNNSIFVEQYQEKSRNQRLWRYGYFTPNGRIVISECLFTKPKKQTLMKIFNSEILLKSNSN